MSFEIQALQSEVFSNLPRNFPTATAKSKFGVDEV